MATRIGFGQEERLHTPRQRARIVIGRALSGDNPPDDKKINSVLSAVKGVLDQVDAPANPYRPNTLQHIAYDRAQADMQRAIREALGL